MLIMEYSIFNQKGYAIKKDNLGAAIKLVMTNIESQKSSYDKLNILSFGRLLEGRAYYHEEDAFYNCLGFEVEVEKQFRWDENVEEPIFTEVGFYSIWKGKSSSYAPVLFTESSGGLGKAYKFSNGCGDHIDISKEIYTMVEVQEVINRMK